MEDLGRAPVFVVGAPRSGTTLLASMLAGHSQIACGPETHVFSKISPRKLRRAVEDKRWPLKAFRLVKSLSLAGQKVHELFGISELELSTYLLERKPSVAAILESLTELHAERQGKVRWAEKTPNHLLHLPQIRSLYPDAPVIRIVRDPRDVAWSMRKLPWASRSVLANAFMVDKWLKISEPFFDSDPLTLTVSYEALVLRPERELRRICAAIGAAYEPNMLETTLNAASVSSPNESWKAANAQVLSTGRIYAWKTEMPSHLHTAVTFGCLNSVKAFGYEYTEEPKQTLPYFPLDRVSVETHTQLFLEAASKHIRIVPSTSPLKDRAVPYAPGFINEGQRQGARAIRSLTSAFKQGRNAAASAFRTEPKKHDDKPSRW